MLDAAIAQIPAAWRTDLLVTSPEQAEHLRPLLDRSRRLLQLVSELETLGLHHLDHDPARPFK